MNDVRDYNINKKKKKKKKKKKMIGGEGKYPIKTSYTVN